MVRPIGVDITQSKKKDEPPMVSEFLGFRGVSTSTMEKYGTKTYLNDEGRAQYMNYPYGKDAAKLRWLKEKGFSAEGNLSNHHLFGKEFFPPGSSRYITVTEGEQDALSVYEMMGHACVSVRGAASAVQDCKAEYDYLNSFERIYLCLDMDKVGREAQEKVRKLFDPSKVYLVSLPEGMKDASDMLQAKATKEFSRLWWGAQRYTPKNISNTQEKFVEILNRDPEGAIASYPFETLQEMTYGIRSKEFVLFTAQEKVGKTEILRAIEHHLLKTTEYNVGIIHLEEDEKRTLQGIVTYDKCTPVHLPDSTVSIVEQAKVLEEYEGRIHLYEHYGSDEPDAVLDNIRYLVSVCGCKFIFLDHITMLVTGYESDDERRKLDYLSTRLSMMVHELDFCLFLVSHVNDNGQTRGSRNIAKVPDLLIHLDRDVESTNFDTRNTTTLSVRGNRYAGKSGPAGALFFSPSTYIMKEKTLEEATEAAPF